MLRIGKDVIVNISTYNHWLGLQWIKSFFPDSLFHVMHIADNHIDGALLCLRPGMFLANPKLRSEIESQLPEKFKNWKIISPNEQSYDVSHMKGMTDIQIKLASSIGMDINILSIDENTCLVNRRATNTIKILEENHFSVVPIDLDYGEIFAGGIHCSTLDIEREDEYIFYG